MIFSLQVVPMQTVLKLSLQAKIQNNTSGSTNINLLDVTFSIIKYSKRELVISYYVLEPLLTGDIITLR